MNNKDNYRLLGIGETVSPGDVYEVDGELIPVESYALGQIIDGDEFINILRPTQRNPIAAVCEAGGVSTDMGHEAMKIAAENVALLDSKHKDYGAGNIAAFGEYGIMVRLSDKMERLKRLLTNAQTPNNESIEDTYRDVCNYAIIALMVRRNLWK